MLRKREALHIQETKHDADDVWWQWHLCHWCEAWETGRPEAEVLNTAFRRPMERKLIRVQRYLEVREANSQQWATLTKYGRKKLLRSALEVMFAPLMVYIELKRRALNLVAKEREANAKAKQKTKQKQSKSKQ